MNPEVKKQIKSIVSNLLGDKLSRVILFGSQARNEATTDSDYDLLIIVSSDMNRQERLGITVALNIVLVKTFNAPFDILLRTENEVSRFMCVTSSVIHIALSEGALL